MGYRSDVAIKCQPEAYRMLVKAISKFGKFFEPDYVGYDERYKEYVIEWYEVKWNDWYEEIKAVESTLYELDDLYEKDERSGYGYIFLRVGDDDTDVETRQNCYDLELYVVRTISGLDTCKEIEFIPDENDSDDIGSIDVDSIQMFVK